MDTHLKTIGVTGAGTKDSCIARLCAAAGSPVVLHRDFQNDTYRPAPLLQAMVAAGQLGRKSGRGFFTC